MAIKSRYLDNLDVVVHIGSETVDAEQIIAAAVDWGRHPKFTPHTSTVWDLVAADFAIDWAKVKAHGDEMASYFTKKHRPTGRTAWVIADDVTGIVLDSIHLAFPWPTEWKTFRDAQTAIDWLSETRS